MCNYSVLDCNTCLSVIPEVLLSGIQKTVLEMVPFFPGKGLDTRLTDLGYDNLKFYMSRN